MVIGIVCIVVIGILITCLLCKDGSRKITGDQMKRDRMVNDFDKNIHETSIPYDVDPDNLILYVNDIPKKDFDEIFSKHKGRSIKFVQGYKDGNKFRYMIPTVRIDKIRYNDKGQTVINYSLLGVEAVSPKSMDSSCQYSLCYGAIFLTP